MRKLSRMLAFVLAVSMLFGLVACSNSSNPGSADNAADTSTTQGTRPGGSQPEQASADGRHQGGTVSAGLGRNPGDFFTPYNAGVVNSYGWAALEPLAWRKSDGNFYPVLAESWEMNNEDNTLTIKLRDGITFSNGDSLNAEDVVFTHTVRNEFGTQTAIGSPTKIEALDELTVQFTWEDFGLNYEQMVLPQYIYSKETYEALSSEDPLTLKMVLMRIEGYTGKMIGQVMGVSEQLVNNRISRFRKKYKKFLKT